MYSFILKSVKSVPSKPHSKLDMNRMMVKIISYLSHVMRKPVYAICEQQRHRSAIHAFIVHCLDSIIPLLAIAKISRP